MMLGLFYTFSLENTTRLLYNLKFKVVFNISL